MPTKKVKPVLIIPSIVCSEEADAALARIAARKREMSLLELGLKEDVDRLKKECATQCEPIKQDIMEQEQALIRYAESRKAELFTKKKSVDGMFGTYGFRASSILKTIKKVTWDNVLGLLDERGMQDCIRIKREVDKEALRQLQPEVLADLGCKIIQEDVFYYELKETELPRHE